MRHDMLQEVIASRRKRMPHRQTEQFPEEETLRQRKSGRFFAWGIILFVGVFGVFAFSFLFSGATVRVTPRIEAFSIDETFNSVRRSTEETATLPFDILTLEENAQKEVPASGSEYVERKASGVIVVYNNYSTKPQKLINNTRFESSDGKIYRIKKPIVAPGKTTIGGEEVPGSVEVTVYADETGASYNIGLTDFTIPGLKGSPMYDGFYARSKTPIEGGFAGDVKKISATDREQATRALQEEIRSKLFDRIFEEKPEGFVLYDDGVFIRFKDGEQIETAGGEDTAIVSQVGKLEALMFAEQALSAHIARRVVDHFDNRPVVIPELSSFQFTLLDKAALTPTEASDISFALAGSGRVIWDVDSSLLQDALAGQPKKDFQKVLSAFLGIERAEIVIRPFWKQAFPENSSKIKIEMMVPEAK